MPLESSVIWGCTHALQVGGMYGMVRSMDACHTEYLLLAKREISATAR